MQKTPELFDARNEQKKQIEFTTSYPTDVRVGEFRWYREGVNVGNEISKDDRFKRVCLILKTDLGNGLVGVAPLTTKYHARLASYLIEIESRKKMLGLKQCWLITNQFKLIDKKRISHRATKTTIRESFVAFVLGKIRQLLT